MDKDSLLDQILTRLLWALFQRGLSDGLLCSSLHCPILARLLSRFSQNLSSSITVHPQYLISSSISHGTSDHPSLPSANILFSRFSPLLLAFSRSNFLFADPHPAPRLKILTFPCSWSWVHFYSSLQDPIEMVPTRIMIVPLNKVCLTILLVPWIFFLWQHLDGDLERWPKPQSLTHKFVKSQWSVPHDIMAPSEIIVLLLNKFFRWIQTGDSVYGDNQGNKMLEPSEEKFAAASLREPPWVVNLPRPGSAV